MADVRDLQDDDHLQERACPRLQCVSDVYIG